MASGMHWACSLLGESMKMLWLVTSSVFWPSFQMPFRMLSEQEKWLSLGVSRPAARTDTERIVTFVSTLRATIIR